MLGGLSVKTHLSVIPISLALSAAASVTVWGTPLMSFELSTTRVKSRVSASRLLPNRTLSNDSSRLMSRNRSFCRALSCAPALTNCL